MPNADLPPRSEQYLHWIQHQAESFRRGDLVPSDRTDWERQREVLRNRLLAAWGPFPSEPSPLSPLDLGDLKREGYRVEKRVLHPRPGIEMTTNVYVPVGEGPFPAVLCVHGHWRGAKQDPTVQARCLGLVKLGFLVLCVDAFGAGERGLKPELGEYHGEMVGATLWPTGLALSGLQVYENMRAIDYLESRPDVDPQRIGVTGASGGGNQSMYIGAIDQRLQAVVPVCSVGTYQAYLGAACCLCEVVPGAISFTEEAGVLGLVAPRGLLVISATRDAFQFSVGEARKSVAWARKVYDLYAATDRLRHATFESPHDYNRPMREAMYGWMTWHLKGEGTGEPIPEPEFETEDPEALRCYPGNSRPATFVTLPQFAAGIARDQLARRAIPDHVEHWRSEQSLHRDALEDLLGGPPDLRDIESPPPFQSSPLLPEDPPPSPEQDGEQNKQNRGNEIQRRDWELQAEPKLVLPASEQKGASPKRGTVLLLDLDVGRGVLESPLAEKLRGQGWNTVGIDLRATASLAREGDRIQRAPDHNTAQWGVWIGRPLLAQWVGDLRRLLDQLEAELDRPLLIPEWGIIGIKSAAPLALCLAAVDDRVQRVAVWDGLTSYVTEVPYEQQRLASMVPGILPRVGDIAHLAALIAPRKLLVAGGSDGGGQPRDLEQLRRDFAATQLAYRLESASGELHLLEGTEDALLAHW